MNNFNAFINRLYALCSKEMFKADIEAFLEFHDNDTVKYKNKDKGHIVVVKRNTEPPYDYERKEISMAGELLKQANEFCQQPPTITGNLNDQRLKRSIHSWTQKLERAKKLSSRVPYIKSYPAYFKALDILIEELEELKLSLDLKKGVRGRSSTLSPTEQAEIISQAEKLLSKDHEAYKPRKGAYVSKPLKKTLEENFKKTIPQISEHKIARLLLKHFRTKDNYKNGH